MHTNKARSRSSYSKRGNNGGGSEVLSMVDSFLAPLDYAENVPSSEPRKDSVKSDTQEQWQNAATRRKMVSEIKRLRPQISEIQSQAANQSDTNRQAAQIVQYNTLSKQLRDFKHGVRSSAAVCIQRAWRRSRSAPLRCPQNFFPFGRAEIISGQDYRSTISMPSSKTITSQIRIPNMAHPAIHAHTVCGSEAVQPVVGPTYNAVGCGVCAQPGYCVCGQWTLYRPSGPVHVACVKSDSKGSTDKAEILFDSSLPIVSTHLFSQCNRQSNCIKCLNGTPQGVCGCVYDSTNRSVKADVKKPVFEAAVRTYIAQNEPHLLQHGEAALARQFNPKTNNTPSTCVTCTNTCGSMKVETIVPQLSALLDTHDKSNDQHKHLRVVSELFPFVSSTSNTNISKGTITSLLPALARVHANVSIGKGTHKLLHQWLQQHDAWTRWPEPTIDAGPGYATQELSFDRYLPAPGSGYSVDITPRRILSEHLSLGTIGRNLAEHQGIGSSHFVRVLRSQPGHTDLKHSLYTSLGTQRLLQQEGMVQHPLQVDLLFSSETALGGYPTLQHDNSTEKTTQNTHLSGHPLTGAQYTQLLPPLGNVLLSSSILQTDVVVGTMRGLAAVSVNKGVGQFLTMVSRGGASAGHSMNKASAKERSIHNIHLPLEALTSKKIESIRSSLKKQIAKRQPKQSGKTEEGVCTGTPICVGVNSVGLLRGTELVGKPGLHDMGASMLLGTLSEDDRQKYRPLYAFYSSLKSLLESPKPLAYRNDQFCSVPHAVVGGTSMVENDGDVIVQEEKGSHIFLDQAGFYESKEQTREGVWDMLPSEVLVGVNGEEADCADIQGLVDTAILWQTSHTRTAGIDTSVWAGILTASAMGVTIQRGKVIPRQSKRQPTQYVNGITGETSGASGLTSYTSLLEPMATENPVLTHALSQYVKNGHTGLDLTALIQGLNRHFRGWQLQMLTHSNTAHAYPCTSAQPVPERQVTQANIPSLRDIPWVDNPTVSAGLLHAQETSTVDCQKCSETAHLLSSSIVLQAQGDMQQYLGYPEEVEKPSTSCTVCNPEQECQWLGEKPPLFALQAIGRTSGSAYQLVAQQSVEFDRRTVEHNTASQQAHNGSAAITTPVNLSRDLVRPVHTFKPEQPVAKVAILQQPPTSDPGYVEALTTLKKEKKQLQYDLNTFEREFEASTGRKIKYQTDIYPVEEKWQRYRHVKTILAKVEDSAAIAP